MDAEREIQRLIKEHGGVLLRNRKHLFYKFPNGATFTMSSTPSDRKSYLPLLSDLRHALGLVGAPKVREDMEVEQQQPILEQPAAEQATEPAPSPEPTPEPPRSPIRQRIDSKIALFERRKEEYKEQCNRLLEQITECDSELEKMTKLLVLCDEPGMESLLSTLFDSEPNAARSGGATGRKLATLQCPYCPKSIGGKHNLKHHVAVFHPEKMKEWPSPAAKTSAEFIGSSVQVSKQLVLACTQTFDLSFTTRDVIDRMIGDNQISKEEGSRIAGLVSGAMQDLHHDGKVVLLSRGVGRTPATWRKVDLTRIGATR